MFLPAELGKPAPFTLPSDLSGPLSYLEDEQIQRLFEAVAAEINRRQRTGSQNKLIGAEPTNTPPQFGTTRQKTRGVEAVPEAKENLIRASFRAGMKPVSIARTFRIPQAVVNRVLSAAVEPKR
jgi:hypothetical protein